LASSLERCDVWEGKKGEREGELSERPTPRDTDVLSLPLVFSSRPRLLAISDAPNAGRKKRGKRKKGKKRGEKGGFGSLAGA